MRAYVYNVDSNEIVVIINGDNNDDTERKVGDLGYLGTDEYGLAYSDNELTETEWTEEVSA